MLVPLEFDLSINLYVTLNSTFDRDKKETYIGVSERTSQNHNRYRVLHVKSDGTCKLIFDGGNIQSDSTYYEFDILFRNGTLYVFTSSDITTSMIYIIKGGSVMQVYQSGQWKDI